MKKILLLFGMVFFIVFSGCVVQQETNNDKTSILLEDLYNEQSKIDEENYLKSRSNILTPVDEYKMVCNQEKITLLQEVLQNE